MPTHARLFLVTLFIGLLAAGAGAVAQPAAERAAVEDSTVAEDATAALRLNQPIERRLARQDRHLHRIDLAANEAATIIVEQRGIDAIVETRRPDGSAIAEFQDAFSRDGEERVDIVSDAAGAYTIVVRGAGSPAGDAGAGLSIVRLVSRRPATDADRAMQQARARHAEGVRLDEAGRSAEARQRFEQALATVEALRGPQDVYVGRLLFELADNAIELRDEPRAESLYLRAIPLLERTYGAEHPYPAMARSRLSLVYQRQGQGPKAEALLRDATDIIERTVGTEHIWFAQCLLTQANLRGDAGDLEKAEALDRRAMAILERNSETENAQYAGLLNNLANIVRTRDAAAAEELFRRALALNQRLQGPDGFNVSIAYQNLGVLARERKDYATALDYYTRALAIREKQVGAEHADIAPLLNNMATLRNAMGDAPGSLDLHFRALRIQERTLGRYHRATLVSVGNIARRYAALGDVASAISFQRRADAIIETQLQLNVTVGSERQKLAFVNSIAERTDRTISLSLREAKTNSDAAALASLVLLQRKGRVLDAMTDAYAAVRERLTDASHRTLVDQLAATTKQLAELSLNAVDERRVDEEAGESRLQARIDALEAEKERLETDLSARSAEFRARLQPVTLEAVRAAIPDEAALLELAVFRPFDPKAERNADAYGAPHYAAIVLRARTAPVAFDLGPAATIDAAIDAFRQSLHDPLRHDLRPRARALFDLVIAPLGASVGGATQLLVSPDGDLNLVPFEALMDPKGRYLIEDAAVTMLTSGRDLLRRQAARVERGGPVIVANPAFGVAAASIAFTPLTGTAAEARAIKTLFPEAMLLTGRDATKAALTQLEGPRLLHIASHGFFLREQPAARASDGGTRASRTVAKPTSPLLRSGLALAGANLGGSGGAQGDDGILTALEAAGLDLWGTKLVTLSACDTGVGDIRNGEGVYGLRRAFVLAGAETLVMSLWPVSDYATRKMMTTYYTGLRNGLGRGDALRRAKLAMLARHRRQPHPHQHPYYWASFIQSGEWASLDTKEVLTRR